MCINDYEPQSPSEKKRKGASLAETIIAMVILSLISASLLNLFYVGKRYIFLSRSYITGGELGRVFLDGLSQHVRYDNWNSNDNALMTGTSYCDNFFTTPQNPSCPSATDRTINNVTYSATYNISDYNINPSSFIRKVTVEINWTEPEHY